MVTFSSGTVIHQGEYLVIANLHEGSSRLASEPFLVSSSVTLANSGLRIRLKNSAGEIIDEVDDGIGVPFAGLNPASPAPKASMERINPSVAGTVKENWRTATVSRGFDAGANVLGSPGFANGSSDASPSSGTSSVSSMSSSISSSESSSASGFFLSAPSSSSSESMTSSGSLCVTDFVPSISLQSGDYTGTDKVTLNVQAVAEQGTMNSVTCFFDFGDGFTSQSCNPPVHSYVNAGVYNLNLKIINQCDTTIIQSRIVTVFSSKGTESFQPVSFVSGSSYLSHLRLSGVLPNPESKDQDKEWIEIENPDDQTVSLAGWHLAIGNKTIRRYSLDDFLKTLAPHETIRLYQIETGISLSNTGEAVRLISPFGITESLVRWTKADEGRVYKSEHFKDKKLSGIITSIIDTLTFRITFDAVSTRLIGSDSAIIRLLGVTVPDSGKTSEQLLLENVSLKFIRDLIENKNVDLFFDSEVWDEDGRLLVYLMIDDSMILQKELLSSGFALLDATKLFSSRLEYSSLQDDARKNKRGFWKFIDDQKVVDTDIALTDEHKIDSSSGVVMDYSSDAILITEVFPSPLSKIEQEKEWIELFNSSLHSVSLEDWFLQAGKKKGILRSPIILNSQSYRVVFAQEIGLKLKNSGDEISLRSPDGSLVASVTYPKTKIGGAYAYDVAKGVWCSSQNPTFAAPSDCVSNSEAVSPPVAVKKSAAGKRYTAYAESYSRTLGQTDPPEHVVLSSGTTARSGMIVSLFFGLLMGSMTTFVIGKVLAMRSALVS